MLEPAHHDHSLDLTAKVHIQIDRRSLEYRRLLAEIVAGGAAPAPAGAGDLAGVRG